MLYLAAKITHILSACVVIGYLVYDIFILRGLKKGRSQEDFTCLKRALLPRAAAVSGVGFVLLFASGIWLANFDLGGEWFELQSRFAKLLWLKISIAFSILIFTPFSLFFVLRGKKDPFRQFYHEIALVICVSVVVIAKIMLY